MCAADALPKQARVVIIGGGIIGTSIAYHFGKLGWKDVILLERKQLTCGTTWHAAGLMATMGFDDETSLYMAQHTNRLYAKLEEETGQSTGFKQVGLIHLITDKEQDKHSKTVMDFNRYHGVEIVELSPKEFKDIWPLAKTDDLIRAYLSPADGRVNPVDVTMALAKGARMGGVKIFEDTKVTGISSKNGRVTGVVTDEGEIKAEYVVNAAGMWAKELGKLAGVDLPLHAAEHYYLITEEIEGIHADLPVVEDDERYTYIREEVGGVMIGMFEPVAAPWAMNGIPKDFTFGEIQPDWDRMMPFIEKAMERVPVTQEAGVHKFFCGPESFTPDLSPLMGEVPGLRNFYVAAGLNSLGILLGGGVGEVMANWIADGYPPVDVSFIDVRRMMPYQSNPKYLYDRTVEMLGLMYEPGFPNTHFKSARNVKRSIFHDRLKEKGAFFGEYNGWEYPDWFAPEGVEPVAEYSWGRQNWFEYWAAEHKACREDVMLLDLSLMAKILVQGKDAEKALNRICANNVAVENGKIVYTQWLNEQGTIEADLTVTRLAEDKFLILNATSVPVIDWLNKNIPDDAHVTITDVTSGYAKLNLQGPKSRELLSKISSVDLSNEAFPYMTAKEIDIGYARALALRITFVGELGWELYIPPESAISAYESILEVGDEFGLKHAGFQALESLRLEKGYRDYGTDIDNTDSPYDVGLGFFVKLDKPGGFIGRDAAQRRKDNGPPKIRLLNFLLEDPEPLMFYDEIIYRDGKAVGAMYAGSYGHTLGTAVGTGYVENEEGVTWDFINNGKFEIKIGDTLCPAKVSYKCFYDPKGEKIKL